MAEMFCRGRLQTYIIINILPLQRFKHLRCFFHRDVLAKWDYVKVKTIRLQGLLLSLFCLRKHLLHLRDIETQYTRTGLGGMWVCTYKDFILLGNDILSQFFLVHL